MTVPPWHMAGCETNAPFVPFAALGGVAGQVL
jgi:hypothetical protein